VCGAFYLPTKQEQGEMLISPREMRYHTEDTGQPTPEAATAPVMDAPASDDTASELEKTRAALKAANAESAKRRKRLEELEAQEAERIAADLSEADKLKKRLADAEAREAAANARLNAELIKGAAASAAVSLQLPFASADALSDAVALGAFTDLEIGSDGKVVGINEAIKQLHKTRPYLFGQGQAAPDINAGARGALPRSSQDIIAAEQERLRRSGKYGGF
jgi:hypothetical protein